MGSQLINDGNLTAEGVASILDYLTAYKTVIDVVFNEDEIDQIDCGRYILLAWCRFSLVRRYDGVNPYAVPDSDAVTAVLAFLASQTYGDENEYDREEMERAQSLILNWCYAGLQGKTESICAQARTRESEASHAAA